MAVKEQKRIRSGIVRKKVDRLSKILGMSKSVMSSRLNDYADHNHYGWATIGADVFSDFAQQMFNNLSDKNKNMGLSYKNIARLKSNMAEIMIATLFDQEKRSRSKFANMNIQHDNNYLAYLSQKDSLLKKFGGKSLFVAFVDGAFLGAFNTEQQLYETLDQEFPDKEVFVKKLGAIKEVVVDFSRPKKILKG